MLTLLIDDVTRPGVVEAFGRLGIDVCEAQELPLITSARCVVLDGGHADIRSWVSGHPDVALIVIVDGVDRRRVTSLLDAGARGVVLRSDSPEALAAAVLAVASGFLVVPLATKGALRRPVFTRRQKEVLGLLVLGLSNAEIASRLFISESTVKMHLSAAFSLLGVRSRKAAIDVILDPAGGLGTGVLSLAATAVRDGTYGSPTIT